ncbi:MAG: type II toxin-antitoxin system VapC family toxin [Nocardioides sp.]
MGVTKPRPKYLLDTHAFIWLSLGLRQVPESVDAVLADPDTRVFVSTISAYEVATKVRLGKWDQAAKVVMHWERAAVAISAEQLSLNFEHASLAGSLDWAHRDPFDRMLVAQAQINGLTLVTADRAMNDAPGVRLLQW